LSVCLRASFIHPCERYETNHSKSNLLHMHYE
jgi:hypothetical protein